MLFVVSTPFRDFYHICLISLKQIFLRTGTVLENAAVGDCGESPVQLVRGNQRFDRCSLFLIGPRPRCTLSDWRDETRNFFASARVPHATNLATPSGACPRLASPSARRSALWRPRCSLRTSASHLRASARRVRRRPLSAKSARARGGVAGWHRARSAGSLARRTRRSLRAQVRPTRRPRRRRGPPRRRPAAPSLRARPVGDRRRVRSAREPSSFPSSPCTTSASPSRGGSSSPSSASPASSSPAAPRVSLSAAFRRRPHRPRRVQPAQVESGEALPAETATSLRTRPSPSRGSPGRKWFAGRRLHSHGTHRRQRRAWTSSTFTT